MTRWQKEFMALAELTPAQLKERAERWAGHADRFFLRQGGGIRDSYNFDGRYVTLGKNSVDNKIESRLIGRKENVGWTNWEITKGTLLGIHDDLKQLVKAANATGTWSDPRLRNRLARLECAFRAGLDTGLTPAQVVRESASDPDRSIATYQYMLSHTENFSPQWEAFVHQLPPELRIPPPQTSPR